jgi:hypothetical protein
MPVFVELDIFSGRPNPRLELSPAAEAECRARLGRLAPLGSSSIPATLGYRGFILELPEGEALVHRGVVNIQNRAFADAGRNLERWLLGFFADSLSPQVMATVRKEIGI